MVNNRHDRRSIIPGSLLLCGRVHGPGQGGQRGDGSETFDRVHEHGAGTTSGKSLRALLRGDDIMRYKMLPRWRYWECNMYWLRSIFKGIGWAVGMGGVWWPSDSCRTQWIYLHAQPLKPGLMFGRIRSSNQKLTNINALTDVYLKGHNGSRRSGSCLTFHYLR